MSKSKELKKKKNYKQTKKRRLMSGKFVAAILVVLAIASVLFTLLFSIYYYL